MTVFLVFQHRPGQDVFAADLVDAFEDRSDAEEAAEQVKGWVTEQSVNPKRRFW